MDKVQLRNRLPSGVPVRIHLRTMLKNGKSSDGFIFWNQLYNFGLRWLIPPKMQTFNPTKAPGCSKVSELAFFWQFRVHYGEFTLTEFDNHFRDSTPMPAAMYKILCIDKGY